MSKRRNQHYVPQVYLREFCGDKDRKCINIWLPNKKKFVYGAPIKHQCSKAYFYGRDGVLEDMFGEPEAWYGKVVRNIVGIPPASEGDRKFLLFFWMMQHIRAEANLMQMVRMHDELRARAFDTGDEIDALIGPPMGTDGMAKVAFTNANKFFDEVSDLDLVILRNLTHIDLFCSDNPAILANRFIQQQHRNIRNWGYASAGNIGYLPISPSFAFLAYDRYVYYLPNKKGSIVDLSKNDVDALNYMTLMHCDNCIYFSKKQSKYYIEGKFSSQIDKIPRERMSINFASLNNEKSKRGREVYSVVDDEKFRESPSGIIHFESLPPKLVYHLPCLRFRSNKRFHSTGTGMGIVRHNSSRHRSLGY